MIFSSFRFLIFFPAVLLLYHGWKNLRWRQWMLLVASYVFYASWDPRFLLLILASTMVDYWVGLKLPAAGTPLRRKALLTISIVANLGILCAFKYANFFISSLQVLLGWMGVPTDPFVLDVVLPVGISFYTFQTMSYSLDIYRGRLEPTRDWVRFALFVAFFPQLVAGPIVRAVELLPQLGQDVETGWHDMAAGLNRFAVGFTKKVLVADALAPVVDRIYGTGPSGWDGPTLWLGAIGFTAQVYCDFSGYSDMAIGCARMMGFRLPENFRYPFRATNVAEFWRRWHITLYAFMRDYLYIALGGGRVSRLRLIFNVLLTMTLVGLWHGAAWRFVLFGFYNGVLVVTQRLAIAALERKAWGARALASAPATLLGVMATNVFFFIGMAIFRSPEAGAGLEMVGRMFTFSSTGASLLSGWVALAFGAVLLSNLLGEVRFGERLAARTGPVLSCAGYAALIVLLTVFSPSNTQAFVYFQF